MADIPLYPTSGTLVSDSLENIMAGRKVEARQKMLDALNAENIQSQIRDRDENTLSNRFNRQGMAEDRAAQAAQRAQAIDKITVGQMAPGQALTDPNSLAAAMRFAPGDVTPSSIQDPGTIDTGKLTAMPAAGAPPPGAPGFNPETPSGPLGVTAPQAPATTPPTYKGTPEYQQIKDIIDNDPEMDPTVKHLLLISASSGKGDPSGVIERYITAKTTQPDPGAFIVGQDGKVTRAVGPDGKPVPSNAHLANAPRPPVTKEPQRPQYVGTDKDGQPLEMMPDGTIKVAPTPTGAPIQPKPTTGRTSSASGIYDSGKYNQYLRAMLTHPPQNATQKEQDLITSTQNAAGNAVIDSIKYPDPDVKTALSQIWNNHIDHDKPVDELNLKGDQASIDMIKQVLRDLKGQ